MSRLSRRQFLGASTAAAAWVAVARAQPQEAYQVVDQVAFRGQTRRLKLLEGDRFMAALLFPTDYPTHFRLKPALYPVCTPRGLAVTEGSAYCFIHQQSITCGHGKVCAEPGRAAVDFYRHLPPPEPGRADRWHRGFNLFQFGPSGMQSIEKAAWRTAEAINLDLELTWRTRAPGGGESRPMLFEQRHYRVARSGPATIIDQHTCLRAAQGPVSLLADRHSLVSVRVHDLLDVEDGGRMRDSEGRVDPTGNYCDREGERRAPRWVDCSGTLGGQQAGLTLIGHPRNVRNQFYVREYGLMTISAMLTEDVRISPEEPFAFAARIVAHDGPLDPGLADHWHAEFAGSAVAPREAVP